MKTEMPNFSDNRRPRVELSDLITQPDWTLDQVKTSLDEAQRILRDET